MKANKVLLASSVVFSIVSKPTYKKVNYVYDTNKKNNYKYMRQGILGLGLFWSKSTSNNSNAIQEDVNIYLEKADKEFDNGRYEDCYNTLIKSKFQNDVDVKWRICRVLYTMAKDSKYDQSLKKDLIKQAYTIIAYELPKSGDSYAVHKWYALILDAKTSFEGYKERIKHLEKIKEHLDFAVALNPNDATTLHMLGEWCYQLSEMPWHQRKTTELLFYSLPKSSYEDALEYFLKAESVQPRFYSINLLRLGSCYVKLNKEDQAKYYLQLAASYPAKSNEDHQANKEATELLKKLK